MNFHNLHWRILRKVIKPLNCLFNSDSFNIIRYRVRQMKHQLDATLCRFYFCRVTLHVSGAMLHQVGVSPKLGPNKEM